MQVKSVLLCISRIVSSGDNPVKELSSRAELHDLCAHHMRQSVHNKHLWCFCWNSKQPSCSYQNEAERGGYAGHPEHKVQGDDGDL